MKKTLIIGGMLAFSGITNAQWFGTSPSPLWSSGQRIGIGTNTPAFALDLRTATGLDGIRINQNGTGAGMLKFTHSTMTPTGAHDYGIYSSGSTDPNPGSLEFYDNTMADTRLFIKQDGNIGVGTRSLYGKLTVLEQGVTGVAGDFESSTFLSGTGNTGIQARASGGNLSNVGGSFDASGATSYGNIGGWFTCSGASDNRGVHATATGGSGSYNIGGTFISVGTSAIQNIGVLISANTSGTPANDWGVWSNARGYFAGAIIGPSDQKLKNNIKPLTNVIEKIKLLRPSTYTCRTEEYKNMNFPQGEQIGLIAQEVEKVFPTVVSEVGEVSMKNAKGEVELYAPQHKGVSYIGLVPVLIKGMQEQQELIEDQTKKIDALQLQVNALTNNKTGNVTGINQLNSATDGFAMDQNIPNPFSHETVIKYILTEQTKAATLNVYDLSGKQITSFPLEKTAPSITITSEKLAAGIYIYSIVADGKIMDSKRMVVAEK